MPAAIALRTDFTGSELRQLARYTRDANQARRLLALAVIYDGGSRSEAARVGGVGLQIIRDGVRRFNADGPEGMIDRKAPGPMPRLNAEHRTALAAAIELISEHWYKPAGWEWGSSANCSQGILAVMHLTAGN